MEDIEGEAGDLYTPNFQYQLWLRFDGDRTITQVDSIDEAPAGSLFAMYSRYPPDQNGLISVHPGDDGYYSLYRVP